MSIFNRNAHIIDAPDYLFTGSKLRADITEWCYNTLKSDWCGVFCFTTGEHTVEFVSEHEAVLFKLRWIG